MNSISEVLKDSLITRELTVESICRGKTMRDLLLILLNGSTFEIKRSETNSKNWLEDSKILLERDRVDVVSIATNFYAIYDPLKFFFFEKDPFNITLLGLNSNAKLFLGSIVLLYMGSQNEFSLLGDEKEILKRVIDQETLLRTEIVKAWTRPDIPRDLYTRTKNKGLLCFK